MRLVCLRRGRGHNEWKPSGRRYTPIPEALACARVSEWHGMLVPKVEEGDRVGGPVVYVRCVRAQCFVEWLWMGGGCVVGAKLGLCSASTQWA